MNLNATILGRAIAFILFVWFCMKYVWPPLMAAIEKRQKEIADGLASAERAHKDLDLAKASATDQLKKAKAEAQVIIEQANKRRAQIPDEAKTEAEQERTKIVAQAQAEIEAERKRAREELRKQVAIPLLLAPRRSSNVPWMKLLTATSWINLSLNCKEGEGLMSEFVTVARPYAKAAFDFAVEHQSVERWQDMLAFAAEVTKNEQMAELLSGALAPETLAESFIAVCGEQLDENGQNLIRVMAENNRLNALPDVLEQFIHLRAASEATSEVEVTSATALSEEQLSKISAAMEKRLSRKVKLNCKIDKSVMAGVIIRAGDMVIDGSVRGRLERLADVLQS